MAYINTATSGEFVELRINGAADFSSNVSNAFVAGQSANVVSVPGLQEMTVNATPGIFRWKALDSLSEYAVTTASTNSLGMTIVLDPTTFYTGAGNTSGIFALVNNKTLVSFRMFWQGTTSGDRYIQGVGYLSGLAATVNPDSPVWTSPLTVEVVGDFGTGTV